MGRSPRCDADAGVKKGPWTPEEDKMLTDYIDKHGCGSWRNLSKLAGLNRCSKSCRLQWMNYLRPDIKRGNFSEEEEELIIHLHSMLGNKWSQIAGRLPRRTDNEIKNYWNTQLRKKLLMNGIDPVTHQPRTDLNVPAGLQNLLAAANLSNFATNPFINNALQLQKLQLLQTIIQVMSLQNLNPLAAPSSFDSRLIQNDLAAPVNYSSCSVMTTPANSTRSLGAASPENCTVVDQGQEVPVNLTSASSSPTSSTPLEGWGGLTMDDLASDDLGWRDILDQISWSDELWIARRKRRKAIC